MPAARRMDAMVLYLFVVQGKKKDEWELGRGY